MTKLLKSLLVVATLAVSAIANAATYTYVGSWNVYNANAPQWFGSAPNGPLAYTGQEAAALLFGGNASDYAISTIGSDVGAINFSSWYDVIGVGGNIFAQDYNNKYLGQFYGPTSGYNCCGQAFANINAASAFVRDNLSGGNAINFAFRIDNVNTVPLPAAAWLFGSALFGFAGMRKRKSA